MSSQTFEGEDDAARVEDEFIVGLSVVCRLAPIRFLPKIATVFVSSTRNIEMMNIVDLIL